MLCFCHENEGFLSGCATIVLDQSYICFQASDFRFMNSHLNAVSAYLYMAVTTCRSYFEAVVNDMMNSSGSVTSSGKERLASALRNCIAGSECGYSCRRAGITDRYSGFKCKTYNLAGLELVLVRLGARAALASSLGSEPQACRLLACSLRQLRPWSSSWASREPGVCKRRAPVGGCGV